MWTGLTVQAWTALPAQEYCSCCIQPSEMPYLYHGYGILLPVYSQIHYPGLQRYAPSAERCVDTALIAFCTAFKVAFALS